MKRIARWLWGSAPYTIEAFTDADGAWRWRLRHANGEILATSEAYSSRAAMIDTAQNLSKWTGLHFDLAGAL